MLLCSAFVALVGRDEAPMFIVGLLLIFVATLVALTAQLWLIGLTFQRSVTVGNPLVVMAIFARLILAFSGTSYQPDPQIYLLLSATTLGSFAVLIITDWQNAKGAFFWWLSGAVMAFGGALLLFGSLNDRISAVSPRTRRPETDRAIP